MARDDCRSTPRWWVRGGPLTALATLAAGLLVLVAAAVFGGTESVARRLVVTVASQPIHAWRWALGPRVGADLGLAMTQAGWTPDGPKRFTAGAPLGAFTVVDATDGRVVWRGNDVEPRPTDEATRWVGDLTTFRRPGRFVVVADTGASSHPFTIGDDVFRSTVRDVQRVFYFQRAFTAIEPRFAQGPWVHRSDAALAPPGVVRGWHDAGDYSLYNMTTVSSLFWLLETFVDFRSTDDDTGIPESGNGVPDLLDEARWGLDWLLSVQTEDGGVRNSTCVVEYGPYGRNDPAEVRPYVHGEVGTIPTARAVGILAYASKVFAPVDAGFADRLLAASRRGWQYLEARPDEHSDGPTCGAYRQDGDGATGRAVRMFAAAGLLVATAEPAFAQAFEAWYVEMADEPSPYRFAAYASLLYRRAEAAGEARRSAIESRVATAAGAAMRDVAAHPYGWSGRYVWGSVAIAFERSAFLVARCLDEPPDRAACEAALVNLDYAFGRNPLRFSYISGVPGVTHGRQRAFHHWLATLDARPFLFPGAVAGGPNREPHPEDGSRPLARPTPIWGYWGDPAMPRSASTPLDQRYTDNDSWSTNELAITWQAAALYNVSFANAMGASRRDTQTPAK